MLGVGLAGAAAALAIAFTARAALTQRRLAVRDVVVLEKKLRTGSDAEVVTTIRSVFAEAAAALLEALTDDTSTARNAGAAALDEYLGDVEGTLSGSKAVPGAAIRIALLGAALGAVLELVRPLGGITSALPAAVIGVVTAAACFELGRNTARQALDIRRDHDRIASALVARLGMEAESGRSGRKTEADQRRRRRRGS